MTSEGHPYARFQRALERRSVANAWAAAHELGHVSLVDALALCLLVLDREPHRYSRVAVRWLGRYCCEEAAVTTDEATLVAMHLAALSRPDASAVAQSLAALLDAHRRRDLANAVRRWSIESVADRGRS